MTTASRIIGAGFENKLLRIKRTIHSTKKLLQWAHFFMDKAGYKKIESPYFNVLRHKTVYCHPRYFNATPENKICIYDILILHMSMEDKSRLISELETLNRDCQHVRKMIFQGYHNCSQIFKDGLFGTSDYNFVHLGVYKKAKAIPTYRDSSQVVFSIKPVIITKEGDGEFDLQHGSRIDIIPFEKIGGYLRNWEAEVMRLGQAAYNDEKFKHYEIQNKFDSWMVWATLLFIIPAELSLILQWNLWFLSFWFVVLVGILANISWPLHSLARYKLFCKLFEDEFFTQRWIDKCNYLKPFLIRSQQLLVQPLEKAQKDPHYEDDKKVRQVHALFSKNSQGEGLGPPIMKPVTKGPLQEEVLNGNALEEKTLQTPPSGEAMERLITPTNPPKRSIKSLLRKKPKHDVNIEIYKVQLGNLYAKLKVTTDLEAFKDTALHMIILILTCEWLRNEGTPPANVRIREVTTRQLDHFSQIERLLKQFLERHPNAIDVEEMYRLASVINIGHLDQKMISHIEWKIEDCLVDCQLLPEEKMKLLLASHRKNTSMPETITKKYPEVELKTTQEPTTNLEMVVDQDTEVVKGEIKVPTKTNASPREESTQPSDQEEIPSELPQSDI